MHSIPIVIPLEEDELLGSWMYRLSKANLFDNSDSYLRNFVRPKADSGYQYIKYNDTEEFHAFYLALRSSTPMVDLYLKTTCYTGLAPFITSGQQTRRVNLAFRRTYGHPEFTPKVTPLTKELRYCKECRSGELHRHGFCYYHRAHQLPGVKVCHKHGCLLNIFKGKIGHEFDDDFPYETAVANAPPEVMQRYALFMKVILDAAPDADVLDAKHAIKDALQRLGYYKRGGNYEKLQSEIEKRGMMKMFPSDVERYIKVSLASLSYPSVEQTVAMAFFLFDTAENFINALPASERPKFWERLDNEEYDLLGSYRKNLVQLRHTCGTEFCVTADGFASGWSCPKCDSAKTNQEIFRNLVSYAGNGEYTLLSQFTGMNTKIALQHCTCRRTIPIKPRSFLFEGVRCICEGQKRKEELFKRMADNKDFDILEYNSRSQHIFARHLKCNKEFECDCDHFLADMRCPHCENGVNLGIKIPHNASFLKWRINALVGEEYTLESVTLRSNDPVMIRHNKCGRSQMYSPWKFLRGRRCSHCRISTVADAKQELIQYLSNGEYNVLAIDNDRTCHLRNSINGQEYEMDFDYVVQELVRPTPSSILPCQSPNRSIHDFVPTASSYYEKILSHLKVTYGVNDVMFKEDFETFGANVPRMKKVAEKLVQKNVVERIYPGIYKWHGSNISEDDVIFQRYIQRQGQRIGYLYGQSFAYELGLLTQKPDRIYIATNKEANLHGRQHKFLSFMLHLRGSKVQATDENWIIIQLLDLLPNLSKYTEFNKMQTAMILRNHIRNNGITYELAIPYLYLYPDWVESQMKKLCEVAKCDE